MSMFDQVSISLNQITGQLEQQVFGAIMGVAQANIAWHQSLLDLDDAIKRNGSSLADNTQQGLSNQLAVLGMVQANQQVYQANIASGMSAEQARAQYEQSHDQLVNTAIAAGYNAGEVHKLTDEYRGVPKTAETEIIARGIRSVLDAINDLIWQLALLDQKSATVDVYYRTHGMPAPSSGDSHLNFMAHGGIRRAATGLIVRPSDPGTLIGEPQTGGEALIPLRGISQGSAASLMRIAGAGYGLDVVKQDQAARWYGASVTPGGAMGGGGGVWSGRAASPANVNVNVTVRDDTGRLLQVIRREVKIEGGGNVQVALGS
jgi:hypothetical protein